MSKRKKVLIIVLSSILFLLIIIALGFSYFLGTQIVANSTQLVTNETTKYQPQYFYSVHYEEFCEAYTVEEIKLTSSFDGHTIPADFIYSGDKNSDIIVMAHGLGGNRYTNYPIAEFFLESGYSVITYDQRSTNENTAEKTTFGYWEKYDLIDCIDYAKEFSKGKKIGVWGESYGGATAVQAVAHESTQSNVDFLILDCPLNGMEWMVEEKMKETDMMGIPIDYMMWCGSTVNKIELGFSYKDTDCAKIAKNINIPTLVINSKVDEVTPYFMGKEIYDNLSSTEKELWTVPDSEHTAIWNDYNEEYRSRVKNLIN